MSLSFHKSRGVRDAWQKSPLARTKYAGGNVIVSTGRNSRIAYEYGGIEPPELSDKIALIAKFEKNRNVLKIRYRSFYVAREIMSRAEKCRVYTTGAMSVRRI